MKIVEQIRIYHLVLAVLALLAYFSDDLRRIHAYLGYAVSAVIVFRLLWSLKGDPQLSLSGLLPSFEDAHVKNVLAHPAVSKTITLGVYLSLIGAAASGIAIDRGRTFGLGEKQATHFEAPVTSEPPTREQNRERRHREKSAIYEAHEFFANIFLIFAVLHIAHSLAFRRKLSQYMFFLKRRDL